MIFEQLIYTIIAFALFVYMFFRMIQKNDTNYTIMLAIQALGILINFIAVFAKNELGIFFMCLKYILGILLPIGVIALEKKGIPLYQITNVIKANFYIRLENVLLMKWKTMKIYYAKSLYL